MKVYAAARDLAGNLAFVGTHQFLIIETSKNIPIAINGNRYPPTELGGGVKGYVLGAHNIGNKLTVKPFEENDVLAAKEYYGGVETKIYRKDFDTEVRKITFETNVESYVYRLFTLADNFSLNQITDPIRYPTAGQGFNSNSWVNSMVKHSGGIYDSNFSGIDSAHDKVIPLTYFMAICPSKPRPRLNIK